MAVAAIRCVCCILFLLASICDERERMIPRWISYLELACGIFCWCATSYVNQRFVLGNLIVSASMIALIVFFYLKGQIGRADIYLVVTMFLLLSQGQNTRALIWEENMLLCVAFGSAAIRLSLRRLHKGNVVRAGCPFAIHLLLGYVVTIVY